MTEEEGIRDAYRIEAINFNPSIRKSFADMVKRGRELTGETLQELAAAFRTSPGTVSRWEHGHSAPPEVSRVLIIKHFQKKVESIHD